MKIEKNKFEIGDMIACRIGEDILYGEAGDHIVLGWIEECDRYSDISCIYRVCWSDRPNELMFVAEKDIERLRKYFLEIKAGII